MTKVNGFHGLKCPQRMVFTAESEITFKAPVSVIAKEWYMIVADLEAREYEFVANSFAILCGWPCRSGSRWADRGRENDRRYLHSALVLALALLYLHCRERWGKGGPIALATRHAINFLQQFIHLHIIHLSLHLHILRVFFHQWVKFKKKLQAFFVR